MLNFTRQEGISTVGQFVSTANVQQCNEVAKMNEELNGNVRALAKQYPLHDIVLAIAHAIDDGARAGVLEGGSPSIANDVQVLLGALGKLSPQALLPGGRRLVIS